MMRPPHLPRAAGRRAPRPNEPPARARHRQRHDPAVPHPGLRPRPRDRARLRRRHGDRRLLRRLPPAQPAAPHVRRGRVLAGLRTHPRRVQEPPGRGCHPHSGEPGRHPARAGGGGGRGARRARRTADHLRVGPGLLRRRGQVRAHRRAHPHHLPLHLLHVAGGARGWRAQHLEPVRDPGFHAGAAQPRLHRHGAVRGAVLRPPGAGAGVGGVPRRPAAARAAGAAADEDRHDAALRPRPLRPRRAPRHEADGAGSWASR